MCLHSEEIPRIHESAADLPLPAKFGPGGSISGVDLIHGQKMTRAWKLHPESTPNDSETSSLMAELMKLLGIWYQRKHPSLSDTAGLIRAGPESERWH